MAKWNKHNVVIFRDGHNDICFNTRFHIRNFAKRIREKTYANLWSCIRSLSFTSFNHWTAVMLGHPFKGLVEQNDTVMYLLKSGTYSIDYIVEPLSYGVINKPTHRVVKQWRWKKKNTHTLDVYASRITIFNLSFLV